MTRAVLLAGGWAHPGDDLIASFHQLLSARNIELIVVTDPGAAATALRAPCDLLVVGSCWFSMTDARYSTEQRAEYGVELDEELRTALTTRRDQGCPLLAIHTAVICFDGAAFWRDWLGGTWNWATSWHPAPASIDVEAVPGSSINLDAFQVIDELYHDLDIADDVETIARSAQHDPLVWLRRSRTGRSAVNLLGHDRRSLDHAAHRALNGSLVDWLLE